MVVVHPALDVSQASGDTGRDLCVGGYLSWYLV